MDLTLIHVIAAVTLLYGLISGRVERSFLTPPMVFVIVGFTIGSAGAGWLRLSPEDPGIHLLAEITLIIVLFSDAARIDLGVLKHQMNVPARLLGIGLPLCILAGTLVARWLFPSFTFAEAALLAAILAPTDAALGLAVVASPIVPKAVRQSINVESGLNDGLALPAVMFFAALACHELGTLDGWALYLTRQIAFGALAGIGVGWLGGFLVARASRASWMTAGFVKLSGIAIALLAYGFAEQVHGNGFIAAFLAGAMLGNFHRSVCEPLEEYAELEGQLLTLVAFLLFGAVLLPEALPQMTGMTFLYAVLSLTVIRIVPALISLVGSPTGWGTRLFVGWFGPRGLASILFTLLILGEFHLEVRHEIASVVMATVLLSVYLHGLSARPGAAWIGRYVKGRDRDGAHEFMDYPSLPTRAGFSESDHS